MQQYGNAAGLTAVLAGPFGSTPATVKLTGITLPAANWKGAISPFFQVVDVAGISMNSMVDLQLSAEQLEAFRDLDIAFTAVNDGGVVTVYAIGDKPDRDYTMQATILEVIA